MNPPMPPCWCGKPAVIQWRNGAQCGEHNTFWDKEQNMNNKAEQSVTDALNTDEMSLAVALHFADYPRPHHTLQAPADTNGELYRALAVLAANYRTLRARIKELEEDAKDHGDAMTIVHLQGVEAGKDVMRAQLAEAQRDAERLREAVNDYLTAQEALDNHELNGTNAGRIFELRRTRNAYRGDLDAAIYAAKGGSL